VSVSSQHQDVHAGFGPAAPGPECSGSASVAPSVVEVPLDRLRAWSGNPRTIRPQRLEELKQAMLADRAMLSARPLLALPDGTVIAGNQRLLAAQQLGWATIPVLTVDLDPERARLWALRDNNQFGEWDQPALTELLSELAEGGVELALTGFAGAEIETILAGIPGPAVDADDAPALPEGEPCSEPGRVYELGRHRLLCGDARDPELLRQLVVGVQPEVVWTDPPYRVDYVGKTRRQLTINNDNEATAAVLFEAALRAADPLLARVPASTSRRRPARRGLRSGRRSRRSAGAITRRSSGSRTAWCSATRIITSNTKRSCMAGGRGRVGRDAAATPAAAGTATTSRARSSLPTGPREARSTRRSSRWR
jgi:hypothetical protein